MEDWNPITKGLMIFVVLLFTAAFVGSTYDSVTKESTKSDEAITDIQKFLDRIPD